MKIKNNYLCLDSRIINDSSLINIEISMGNYNVVFKGENPKLILKAEKISLLIFEFIFFFLYKYVYFDIIS